MPDQIPDSCNLEQLKALLSSDQQRRTVPTFANLPKIAFGDSSQHTGFMDLRLLIAYIVANPKDDSNSPSTAQLIAALAGLGETLLSILEEKLQTFAEESMEIAEAMLAARALSADEERELREKMIDGAGAERKRLTEQVQALRAAVKLFSSMESEAIAVQIAIEHAARAGMLSFQDRVPQTPKSVLHRMVSDAFLESVGCSRQDFESYLRA